MNKEEVRIYLSNLDSKEFVELFYSAAKKFTEESQGYPESFDSDTTKLCITQVTYGSRGGFYESLHPDDNYFICLPAGEAKKVDWGDGFSQIGKCSRCGVMLISIAKTVSCAVCGEENTCT